MSNSAHWNYDVAQWCRTTWVRAWLMGQPQVPSVMKTKAHKYIKTLGLNTCSNEGHVLIYSLSWRSSFRCEKKEEERRHPLKYIEEFVLNPLNLSSDVESFKDTKSLIHSSLRYLEKILVLHPALCRSLSHYFTAHHSTQFALYPALKNASPKLTGHPVSSSTQQIELHSSELRKATGMREQES